MPCAGVNGSGLACWSHLCEEHAKAKRLRRVGGAPRCKHAQKTKMKHTQPATVHIPCMTRALAPLPLLACGANCKAQSLAPLPLSALGANCRASSFGPPSTVGLRRVVRGLGCLLLQRSGLARALHREWWLAHAFGALSLLLKEGDHELCALEPADWQGQGKTGMPMWRQGM